MKRLGKPIVLEAARNDNARGSPQEGRTMNKLERSRCLVTGASRGLGRALAQQLATLGAEVVMVARHGDALEQAANAIAAEGARVHAVSGDVGVADDVERIVGTAQALAGPIDVLINNASTLGPTPLGLLLDTENEDFERVLAVNLLGPFRLTRALAGGMLLHGGGVVVNVSSDAAVEAYPNWGAYGVSKAALDHLTRIWAAELGSEALRIVSVDPGEMDTAMHAAAIPDADPSSLARPQHVARSIVNRLRQELRSGERWVLASGEAA
jgi:NAD(P)-dependent dehydrogenase (short-subunit alcohol dehydrogenase family)